MRIGPTPPANQPENPENKGHFDNWGEIIHYLNTYMDPDMDTESFQRLLDGLGIFAGKAGPETQTAFHQLQADFKKFCHDPSIGIGDMQKDISRLQAAPAVLSNNDFIEATLEEIARIYDIAGNGGDVGETKNLLTDITFDSTQLPAGFASYYFGPEFSKALSDYIYDPSSQNSGKLQAALIDLQKKVLE